MCSCKPIRCALLVGALLLAGLASVRGQRVFARIASPDPSQLRFDTNSLPLRDIDVGLNRQPDLNFAPNIVFSPDSSRGFVSYSSSDKVMVFAPATGEIIRLIQVAPNPSQITLTPDGRHLAVVCLLLDRNTPRTDGNLLGDQVGAISIIDVETLEARTLNLEKTFFSFANNIVFSADSKTGFVASSATDEILRFDVDTAQEITPRLEVGPGGRPASLAMAPDGTFFTAVLIGSPSRDKFQTPDSIWVIDTAQFKMIREIVPENDQSMFFAHDFFSYNTLAISNDGKFGFISDSENSNSQVSIGIPELVNDHGILLDLETGETVKIFDVGGVSHGSFTVPGRNLFVNVGAVNITVVNTDTMTASTLQPPRSEFRQTTRPAFTADGRTMFIASPLRDLLMKFDLSRHAFTRSLGLGPQVLVDVGGGVEVSVPAGPLELALTPDGSVLAALAFNADRIDLLRDSQRLIVPQLFATPDWFTGIAITNSDDSPARIFTGGFQTSGLPFTDDPRTDDVVEFTNPGEIDLPAGGQKAFTAADLLEPSRGKHLEGWLDLDSDRFRINGLFLTGDPSGRRLDGGVAVFDSSQVILLPEVRVEEGLQMEIDVVNPNQTTVRFTATLISSDGEGVATLVRPLTGRSTFSAPLLDPDPMSDQVDGLFPNADLSDFQDGYIFITSGAGVVAYERYFDDEREAIISGIPVPVESDIARRLFVPQVVLFGGSSTYLRLINPTDQDTQVSVALRGDQGGALASPVTVDLPARQTRRLELAQLLDVSDPGTALSGWLEIESDSVGIFASSEIQTFAGRAMTAQAAQDHPGTDFIFAHVAQGLGFWTGLAIVNPGDKTATVSLEVRAPDGTSVSQRTVALDPGHRLVGLLPDLFPGMADLVGGSIRLSSDQGVVGMELFFDTRQTVMATVPAQPVGAP